MIKNNRSSNLRFRNSRQVFPSEFHTHKDREIVKMFPVLLVAACGAIVF